MSTSKRNQQNATDNATDDAATVIGESFSGTEAFDSYVAEQASTDLAPVGITDDELRAIESFDDAIALATTVHGEVTYADKEIGNGFALLDTDDKGLLVGIPLFFIDWNFNPGDFGASFVSIRLVTKNRDGGSSKYIINDGSTGIAEALKAYTARTGRSGAMLVKNGLRASDYQYCELCKMSDKKCEVPDVHKETGQWKKATTYYLDTSA